MASGFPGDAVRQINRLFRDGTAAGLTDGQLIERFTTRRAEVAEIAFEALVNRHGPMVLRVVKGVLRDPHDVEDAFQATFLVLVKKAHAIGERELLAPWLYGVAHRVALKARGVAARRNRREGGVIDDPPAELSEGPWLDLRPILHEELNRLPEKYKKPVILCHLQGLTHAEAAQELAWPVGTVSVRLARARKLLKDRLTRRGLTVTATLWATGLSAEGATVVLPQTLIQSTVKAALAASIGKLAAAGTASAGAITLSKRILSMMLISRMKWLIAPLAFGLGAAGGVVVNEQIQARSALARAKVELAEAKAPKPAAEGEIKAPAPRNPGQPASPFELMLPDVQAFEGKNKDGGPEIVPIPNGIPVPPPKVEPPLAVFRNGHVEFDPPPGYFDLPAPNKNDGTDPPLIKTGQWIQIEVLEALPGRPIEGARIVRPDGTISLGYYGELRVVGLNRHQVKVKLIEHLRQYLNDEVLGFFIIDENDKPVAVPPIQSNRVFVDDFVTDPAAHKSDWTRYFYDKIEYLEGKIHLLTEEVKRERETIQKAKRKSQQPSKETSKEIADLQEKGFEVVQAKPLPGTLEELEQSLFKTLKEVKDLRAEMERVEPAAPPAEKPAGPTPPTQAPKPPG